MTVTECLEKILTSTYAQSKECLPTVFILLDQLSVNPLAAIGHQL